MQYWAMIHGVLTLTSEPGHPPARFWGDYVFRADSIAGSSYLWAAWVLLFCTTLLCHGLFGQHDTYWGRGLTIAFGPLILGTWLAMTYANFRRWIV
jgi:hypothetical protein